MRWPFSSKERVVHEFKVTQEDAMKAVASRGQVAMRARVFRASTGTWQDLGVIYKSDEKKRS